MPDYHCLKGILDRALEQRLMRKELESLKKSIVHKNIRYRMVGNTAGMQKIRETIEEVKDSDINVLVCGEPGSGKELIARVINSLGKKDGPFISLNCSTMPKELVEAELFGWENGTFADMFSRRLRRLEEVSRGTMFFEEIGDLNPALQAKVLKVIERKIDATGCGRKSSVDFRIITSTKRDLKQEVRNGSFREDLFRHINQREITVPPLRERKDDIPLLVSAFVQEFCEREQKTLGISEKVLQVFENYDWPGNVRQLRNVIERGVILASADTIALRDVPEELLSSRSVPGPGNPLRTFKELETEALRFALQSCKGNKSKASKILGISRKAMYKRLREIQT
jgi:DNA-binding NtrC family response regulator